MGKWLGRIRGAIGMGFTWAAAWFAAGLVPRWLFGFENYQTSVGIPPMPNSPAMRSGNCFEAAIAANRTVRHEIGRLREDDVVSG